MILTQTYSYWALDPDYNELVISATKEIQGYPVNYTFRVPAPKRKLDPNKPVKITKWKKKLLRVWQ